MNALTKSKGAETDKQIRDAAEQAGEAMRGILSTSVADSVLLKNRHNELFLRLMESLERDKNVSLSPSRQLDDPTGDQEPQQFADSITPKK